VGGLRGRGGQSFCTGSVERVIPVELISVILV
jgi:NADH:ubiquinone oxidoreductase subunit F (NADH-binding)